MPKTLVNILSNCDSVSVLIWASAAGWMASLLLVCGQGILTLPEAMDTWMEGMKVQWGAPASAGLIVPLLSIVQVNSLGTAGGLYVQVSSPIPVVPVP